MSAGGVLERATRALRDRTDGASSDAGKTRARILATASSGRRRRLVTTVLPLAAVLAVSTAWADTHGWLAQVWERAEQSFGRTSIPSLPSDVKGVPARTESPSPPAATGPEIPAVALDSLPKASASIATPAPVRAPIRPPTPTVLAPASTVARASTSAPASPSASASAPSSADDPASLLYAAAHRAHFVDRDPNAALRAWDTYLLAAPNGPLAPEARYNRAITLIRLGRIEEARGALTPFATGAYGTYRAREARELLDALNKN
jgi:hypothetical protein